LFEKECNLDSYVHMYGDFDLNNCLTAFFCQVIVNNSKLEFGNLDFGESSNSGHAEKKGLGGTYEDLSEPKK
jgi:hypothetical protein